MARRELLEESPAGVPLAPHQRGCDEPEERGPRLLSVPISLLVSVRTNQVLGNGLKLTNYPEFTGDP